MTLHPEARPAGPDYADMAVVCRDITKSFGRDIIKSFGNVQALRQVSITARRGEITALVGDNGAGKSTLVRCIAGVHRPDHGELVFDGQPVHFHGPEAARRAGIETVHQTLALVDDLTIGQNLFLNRERVRRLGPFPRPGPAPHEPRTP